MSLEAAITQIRLEICEILFQMGETNHKISIKEKQCETGQFASFNNQRDRSDSEHNRETESERELSRV